MTRLPETSTDYGSLFQIPMGPIKASLMMAGVELGIFNRLETFRSAEDVALDMGAHPENTRRFLDALVTIDLLGKQNGLYRNLPASEAFLIEGFSTCVGALFEMIEMRSVDPLKDLVRLVKEGPKGEAAERHLGSQELWAELTRTGMCPGSRQEIQPLRQLQRLYLNQ